MEETLGEEPCPFARGVAAGCGPSSPSTYYPAHLENDALIAERYHSRESSSGKSAQKSLEA